MMSILNLAIWLFGFIMAVLVAARDGGVRDVLIFGGMVTVHAVVLILRVIKP